MVESWHKDNTFTVGDAVSWHTFIERYLKLRMSHMDSIVLADLQPEAENILGLTQLGDYAGSVYAYRKGHSELILHFAKVEDAALVVVHFEVTSYFEGPLSWTGANLCVASLSTLLDLLGRVSIWYADNRSALEALGNQLPGRLCVIKTTTADVKIVANLLWVEQMDAAQWFETDRWRGEK